MKENGQDGRGEELRGMNRAKRVERKEDVGEE
jgi:hypothetical protein